MADTDMMRYGMTPFESFMVAEKTSKRPSGAAVAGLVLGSVGAAAAIGAWIFGPTYAASRSRGVEALANAQYNATNNQLSLLTGLLAAERTERVAQGNTITQTVTDTLSGSQQGTLTAQQASELSSIQTVQNQLLSDAITGRSSLNPTPISMFSSPQPCGCPCGS